MLVGAAVGTYDGKSVGEGDGALVGVSVGARERHGRRRRDRHGRRRRHAGGAHARKRVTVVINDAALPDVAARAVPATTINVRLEAVQVVVFTSELPLASVSAIGHRHGRRRWAVGTGVGAGIGTAVGAARRHGRRRREWHGRWRRGRHDRRRRHAGGVQARKRVTVVINDAAFPIVTTRAVAATTINVRLEAVQAIVFTAGCRWHRCRQRCRHGRRQGQRHEGRRRQCR